MWIVLHKVFPLLPRRINVITVRPSRVVSIEKKVIYDLRRTKLFVIALNVCSKHHLLSLLWINFTYYSGMKLIPRITIIPSGRIAPGTDPGTSRTYIDFSR